MPCLSTEIQGKGTVFLLQRSVIPPGRVLSSVEIILGTSEMLPEVTGTAPFCLPCSFGEREGPEKEELGYW